jgi:hypothetical protein
MTAFYYFVTCATRNKRTNPKYFLFCNEGSIYEVDKAEKAARLDIDTIVSAFSKQDRKDYIAFVERIAGYSYKVLRKYFQLYKTEDDINQV